MIFLEIACKSQCLSGQAAAKLHGNKAVIEHPQGLVQVFAWAHPVAWQQHPFPQFVALQLDSPQRQDVSKIF